MALSTTERLEVDEIVAAALARQKDEGRGIPLLPGGGISLGRQLLRNPRLTDPRTSGDVLPVKNGVDDLGAAALQYKDLHLSGQVIANRTRHVWMPAVMFQTNLGPATLSIVNSWGVWVFAAGTSNNTVTGSFVVPADWTSGTIQTKWYWFRVDDAGNVVLRTNHLVLADGEDTTTGGVLGETIHASSGPNILEISTGATIAVSAGDIVRLALQRRGADPNDTLGVDMNFLGMEFEYTADM